MKWLKAWAWLILPAIYLAVMFGLWQVPVYCSRFVCSLSPVILAFLPWILLTDNGRYPAVGWIFIYMPVILNVLSLILVGSVLPRRFSRKINLALLVAIILGALFLLLGSQWTKHNYVAALANQEQDIQAHVHDITNLHDSPIYDIRRKITAIAVSFDLEVNGSGPATIDLSAYSPYQRYDSPVFLAPKTVQANLSSKRHLDFTMEVEKPGAESLCVATATQVLYFSIKITHRRTDTEGFVHYDGVQFTYTGIPENESESANLDTVEKANGVEWYQYRSHDLKSAAYQCSDIL